MLNTNNLSVDRLESILLDFGWEEKEDFTNTNAIVYTKNNKMMVLPSKNNKHIDNKRRWKVAIEKIIVWLEIDYEDIIVELQNEYEV